MPNRLRPIGAIVTLAGITGIVTFVAFGFVSPDTYIIAEETPDETEEEVPTGPTFAIKILSNSSVQGNPDYDPDVAYVQKGFLVKWTNEDAFAHTVTSSEDMGETFDSGMIDPEEEFILDTSELEIGEYPYFCLVHPWMKSQLFIEESKEPASVVIPEGAGVRSEGQVYFDPQVLEVSLGTTVKWNNEDTVAHTVTSGTAQGGPNGLFDSGMILAGDSFQFTFTEEEVQDYYCVVHPWMEGSVKVG